MSKPDRLLVLACEVAVKAPLRRGQYSSDARIPWWVVEEIREELAARGVDWKAAHAKDKAHRDAIAAERAAERYRNPS